MEDSDIYGTPEQWDQLFEWLNKEHPILTLSMANRVSGDLGRIANFGRNSKEWLLENCPFDWVKETI
jgi:hypothetical protein